MSSYKITSVKISEELTGTLEQAIERANEINAEYQPSFGVQVECDGETVFDTEDDGSGR